MNKILKRSVAVAMAAATALTISGCNKSETSGSAASGETLVIGGIGPTTGDNAQYGIAVQHGMELAAEEINANGGVNGMKLEVKFEDDQADPEKGMTAYNSLKDKGMKMLLGTVTSGSCTAVSALAAEDNMFLFTPSGSAINCITAGDNCFRMCFTDPNQGAIAADYIADNLSAKKIGVIYQNDSDYSVGIFNGFKEEAGKKGLEIVAETTFTEDSATDFSQQVKQIGESGAELLFLPFYYTQAALVLQEADKQGLDIPAFGGDGLDGLIGVLGDKITVADGVYVMSPYASTSPEEKSAAFTKAYQAKFPNDEVNQFAADGYDCVYAVKQALEQAGVKDASISASELCDKLKSAMTSIEFDGVTGKTKWTADGEPEKAPKVLQITVADGKGSYKVL